MPKKYVKKKEDVPRDCQSIIDAIKDIKIDNKSVFSVAKNRNIPYRSLYHYIEKLDKEIPNASQANDEHLVDFVDSLGTTGPKKIFTPTQEKALMKYLIDASNLCYGLSRNEMRRLARKIGVECPSSWTEKGFAGKDWYVSFMRRHNLTLRAPEHISSNRLKAFNKTSVDRFFDQLKSVMIEHNFEASRIWNIDETGFSAAGIFPLNINIFTEEDYQLAAISDENVSALAEPTDPDDQRNVLFFKEPPGAHEEVTTSTSEMASTSGITSTSSQSLSKSLQEIGPLKHSGARKKSNRGRKAMQSSILTSADERQKLEKSAPRTTRATNKTPAKRQRKTSSSSSEADYCLICEEKLPKRLNRNNSIRCNTCKDVYHLKCANMTGSFFTCRGCETDSD